MKRWPKRILCVSAMLMAGLVALLVWRPWVPSEPVYQGKKLSAWIDQWSSSVSEWGAMTHAPMPEAGKDAEEAILRIGTNGIPFLLTMIRAHEPAIKPLLRRLAPDSWHKRIGLEDMEEDFQRIRGNGIQGLEILGTNAGPAVPALIELISVEIKKTPQNRLSILHLLSPLPSMGSSAEPAIPFLIKCLTNSDQFLSNEAARTLGRMRQNPEQVVPPLLSALEVQQKTGHFPGDDLIEAIGQFGTNARTAAPALTKLLTNQDPSFSAAARIWLPAVDPAAAELAGIRIYKTR